MSDSTNPIKYNFPYRTNYEAYLFLTWFVAAVLMFMFPYISDVPRDAYWFAGVSCLLIGMLTGRKSIEIYIKKQRLKGYPLEFIDPTTPQSMELFGIDKEVIARVQKNKSK